LSKSKKKKGGGSRRARRRQNWSPELGVWQPVTLEEQRRETQKPNDPDSGQTS
jgi:hypothetical protein